MADKPSEMPANLRSGGSVPKGEMPAGSAFSDTPSFLMWAQGIKPMQRVVRLFAPGERFGERERLGYLREEARAAGDERLAEDLTNQIETLTNEMLADSQLVTLQAISPSKMEELTAEAKRDPEVVTDEDQMLYVMAHQIVDPVEMTYKWVKTLNDLIPTEMGKLGTAWAQLNSTAPNIQATIPL